MLYALQIELLGEGGNNNLAETLNVLAEKTGKASWILS